MLLEPAPKTTILMDAITALHTRVSASRLGEPAPSAETLRDIMRAALRAADHAMLRPWRFLLIRGQSRDRLGQLFVDATLTHSPDTSPELLNNIRAKPLRAPIIITGIVSPRNHPKVPLLEQQMSTAAAMQNMLLAAHALGVGAIWRTGPMVSHATVKAGLGLCEAEEIAGFLYMGSIEGPQRPLREESPALYFQDW